MGNARSILSESNGEEIDSHDLVLRLNQAPLGGFSESVGTMTTHRMINHKVKQAESYRAGNLVQN